MQKDLLRRIQAIEDVVFLSDNTAEELWDFLVRAALSVPDEKTLNMNQGESEFCRHYNINKEETITELRERIQLYKIRTQFQR